LAQAIHLLESRRQNDSLNKTSECTQRNTSDFIIKSGVVLMQRYFATYDLERVTMLQDLFDDSGTSLKLDPRIRWPVTHKLWLAFTLALQN
jgi:hypothetical protein